MQPWPTAYTYLHRAGKEALRVIIIRAPIWGLHTGHEPPPVGTVTSGELPAEWRKPTLPRDEYVWLEVEADGNTIVKVLELQPAGKKRMTAEEFLRGYPLKEGDRFGPEVVS
jgi:methionyl-tRNA formyltransferase